MKSKWQFLSFLSVLIFTFTALLSTINVYGKSEKKGGACPGNCSGCNGCGNQVTLNDTYYKSKEADLLDALEERQKVFKNVLKLEYTEEEIIQITKQTRGEFISLIPQIPYIGGDDNSLTEEIEQAAMVLAFYRVEKKYGKSVDYVGTTVYQAIKSEMQKYPKWLLRLNGGSFFTKSYIKELQKDAERSQKKEYTGAWVTTFIEGDGKNYDYGYNHTECGIVKFFQQQDAEELTPYLCKLDFLYSDMMDQGLRRTGTLVDGSKYCDFRYKRVENRKLDFMMYAVFSALLLAVILSIVSIIRKIVLKRKLNKHLKNPCH